MSSGEVFRVMLRMRIRPGMEEKFEKTWYQVGDTVTNDDANLGQWLSKSIDEDGVYYVVSDWIDEDRFRRFEHSEQHVHHREKLHPYRIDGSMTTMHVVCEMAGAAVR